MFKDFKALDKNQNLYADICIVGTGPAGISVAKKLLGTNNKVLFIESGGLEPSEEYNELNKGINSGPRFLSLNSSRSRCFGGASRIWAGVCSPFSDDDFIEKSYLPLSGWPISKKMLNKYYIEAAEMLGISFDNFSSTDAFKSTLNGLSFPEFYRNNSLLADNIYQLADQENRNFAEKYRLTFAESRNIDVLFHATVTKLVANESGKKIKNILIEDLSGNKCKIISKYFVLASGALENPRLLLNSNDYFKNGIGNDNNYVGTCFMSHPGFSEAGELFKFAPGFCINNQLFSNNLISQFGNSSYVQKESKILRHGFDLKTYRDLVNPSTYLSGRLLTEYEKLFKNFSLKEAVNKTSCRLKGVYASNLWNVGIALEQQPSKRNYLKLDLSTKDKLGMPLIDMYWAEISSLEKRTLIESIKNLGREMAITNSGRVRLSEKLLSGELFEAEDSVNHHIGTTRMAKTSNEGVVDKNCKVFGLANLYISGSSVFPTSSTVNPTFTIIALSLRLGEHIKKLAA
jgi:choline dehydrogenase-like flavoprotein